MIIFAHDHVLKKNHEEYFTAGGFSDSVTSRYTSIFGNMILLCRYKDIKKINDELAGYSKITNEKIQVKAISSKDLNKFVPAILKIKKFVKDGDGLIARLPSRIGFISVFFAKKYRKKYLIECVACPWDAYRPNGVIGKIVAPFMYLIMKKQVNNAPYCLYVTKSFLQKRYPCKGKCISCSDVEIVESNYNTLNNRLDRINKLKKTINLGTLANVDLKYKNQEEVIKIIDKLNKKGKYEYYYHLAGQGNPSRLKKIASKYGVSKYIIFDGPINHKKINDWFKTIDIYIQPSKQEGLPRSVIEAMSQACPVLGSNVGGIPELINRKYIYKIGNCRQLELLLSNLSVNDMINMAKENFYKSKEYNTTVLGKKRNDFYNLFMKEIKNA